MVSELALAIILLTGAGLMVKSFWKMYANPPGFAPEDTLVMKVALSGPQYADKAKRISYFTELLNRLAPMPGVRAAGFAHIRRLSSCSPTARYLRRSINSGRA